MERPERYGAPDPEQLDTTPVDMPIGYMRPTPLQDLIANMVRQQIEVERQEEFETMDEADDFEEEDPDTLDLSAYSLTALQTDQPMEFPDEQSQEQPTDEPSEPADPPDPHVEEAS